MPHEPIDLDALVETLEQEKYDSRKPDWDEPEEWQSASDSVESEPQPELVASIEWEPEPERETPESDVKAEDTAYTASLLRISAEDQEADRRKDKTRKQRRRLRRRRKEPEVDVEAWADWGLVPLGHSQANHGTDSLESTTQGTVEQESTAQAPAAEPPIDEPVAAEPTDTEPVVHPAAEPEPFAASVGEFPPVKSVVTEPQREKKPAAEEPSLAEKPEESAEPAVAVEPVDLTPTRIIPAVKPEGEPASVPMAEVSAIEPVSAEMPDQLSMEELMRVESVEETEESSGEDPVERLHQTRQEKIRDFVLSGEEETNEPEEEPEAPQEEPEEIEEFSTYEDAGAVQLELQYRQRTAGLSLLLSGLLELAALVLMLLMVFGVMLIPTMGYLTVQAFVLVLLAVLNYPAVVRGLSGLISLRANSDSSVAAVLLFGFLGVVAHFFRAEGMPPAWPALAGLSAVCSAACRYMKTVRVQRNFTFISYPGEKYAAALMTDAGDLQEIRRRVSLDSDARLAYFHPAAFLSDYLRYSAEEDGSDRCSKWLTPLMVLLSLAIPVVLLLTGSLTGFFSWVEASGYLLCLSAVPLGMVTQVSLWRCSNRMLEKGGFLVGYKAVQTFGALDGLTLDVSDLYPDESVLLHGIKTFSGTHIDEAIVDAASLSIRAGGPLSLVFRRIIENKLELLSEVDSLVYEQGMGLSGWVNGRRVLVGNRRLLQNHGVDVPSSDYEARYAKNGRQLVYLSTAGELSAMFVVSYQPNKEIRDALQELCRAKVTLLLRSCDPNLTAESICRDFDLDEYYVEVLPTPAGRVCERLMAEKSETAPAVLASNGHVLGSSMALSVCRSLRVKYRIAQIVSAVVAAGGLLLGSWWAMKGIGGYAIPALLYGLVSSLVALIAPAFRRM